MVENIILKNINTHFLTNISIINVQKIIRESIHKKEHDYNRATLEPKQEIT